MHNKLAIYSKEDLDKILSEAYMNIRFDDATLPIQSRIFQKSSKIRQNYLLRI